MTDFVYMQPAFPKDFLWGSATSSHQIEGGNRLNDWWAWEQTQPEPRRSGTAADSWELWEQDLHLLKSLGHNSYRFSVEWSRIEPTPGKFNPTAIAHYRKMLEACRSLGIVSVVTLHHFTNPQWFSETGGWLRSDAAQTFTRYAKRCLQELGSHIGLLITINEPQVYAYMGYQVGAWPPHQTSKHESLKAMWHMAQAHKHVYAVAKTLCPTLPVGIAYNMTTFAAEDGKLLTKMYATLANRFANRSFYWLSGYRTHDFLGINYYFHRRLRCGTFWKPEIIDPVHLDVPVSDLGWELFPNGVAQVVNGLRDARKPIIITEHGLADAQDHKRTTYLQTSIQALLAAKREGALLIGYLHWSLLDNFEWAEGFAPRFGLVEVDYATQERKPRPSAYVYKKMIMESEAREHPDGRHTQ